MIPLPGLKTRCLQLVWTILLLPLILLCDARPDSPQEEYDRTWKLFVRGSIEESQLEANQGYQRYSPSHPEWAAKFRLLEARAMTWRGMDEGTLRLLSVEPSLYKSPDDIIDKLTLEAGALTDLQQSSAANEKIAAAEALCVNASYLSCGRVFGRRGRFYMQLENFREARKAFLESLAFARDHRDKWLETLALGDLGWVSLQDEHYDEALDWSRSEDWAAGKLGAEGVEEEALGNTGWAFFKLGDAQRASELLQDAEHRAAKLKIILDEIIWLETAGVVYQDTGDFIHAEQSYRQSLELARKFNRKDDIVNALEDLAHLSVQTGKSDEASAYLAQLDPMVKASGNKLDALDVLLAQGEIAAARHEDQQAEALFRTVEQDPASQTSMKLGAEHQIALLYEREGRSRDAEAMYKTSLTTFESARAQIKNEDSKLPFLANATPIYDDYIHLLVSQGKTQEALVAADQSRARTLAQGLGQNLNPEATPGQVGKKEPTAPAFHPAALNPGAVAQKAGATLLFYWLGEKQSYLWTITPQKTTLFPLPAAHEITPLVERYRKALLGPIDPLENGNEDGRELYRTLVAPAAALLKPNQPVTILADGALSLLNFETLLAPGPASTDLPHYWIDDVTLLSAPSLAMMAAAKPVHSTRRNLLLLGDAVSPSLDYPELPLASQEMTQIEKHFPARDESIFDRQQANPSAYLDSNPAQYSYIHFVTHGVASSTDPLDSAIILSRAGGDENSFKLYAREIMQHPIDARLVTIAACYGSGTKAYVGEGLVGLSWAFLRAGSHNVIGALWEASDDSTPQLMDALYQGIDDGEAPATALRRAKLAMLHSKSSFRRPFYWAPFQLYTRL
jgi:CHAT domain-containing protein